MPSASSAPRSSCPWCWTSSASTDCPDGEGASRRGTGRSAAPAEVANVWPSRKDLQQSSRAIGRGSVLGFFLGTLPGGGARLSSLAAHAMEKKRSKTPERFGRGAVEGAPPPREARVDLELRRRSPVGKLLMGSSAQRILDADRPVLAVKP